MRASTPIPTRYRDVVAQVAWWAPGYLIAILGLFGGIASLLAAQPVAVTIWAFAIVVIAGTGQIRTRGECRRGWRYGSESAARIALEYQPGRTPDLEASIAVRDDPIPEPWEEPARWIKPRSLM
ncbi:hypothetical protein QUV83_10255 [Cellulomonas cellasea]|uniref:hypothetical protein n=1 Tax=Cellulomonas cellasea TaxID=43670 RepID=UPI0025A3E486|nr:hypothetical protein [Cellulomonas cellasea]MDM8085147.1 hypothetical protein [Cellulomonas cellasea]